MLEIRRCFTCGDIMHYRNFRLEASNGILEGYFTHEIVEEIWANPIFVIKCCKCFYGTEAHIERIQRIINIVKKMKDQLSN